MPVELFNPQTKAAVQVPDEQVHDALKAGYGYTPGARVHVNVDGELGSVPIEHLQQTLGGGGTIATAEELGKAQLQKDYGSTAQAAETVGLNALDTATLGASNFVAGAVGGKATRAHLRKLNEANPISAGIGTAAGMAVPLAADLVTGGAATPLVAPELAGAAARLGVGGAEALTAGARGAEALSAANLAKTGASGVDLATGGGLVSKAASTAAAPLRGVSTAGDIVKAGLQDLVGTDATSTIGKAAQAVLPHVGKTATEGAIFGAAQHVGDESLQDDPHIIGEKLMHAIGYGALIGGGMGIAEKAVGSLIPKIGKAILGGKDQDSAAEFQALKSLSPTVAHVKEIERAGGEKAIGRRVLDAEMPAVPGMPAEKVLKAGMTVDELAPRLEAARAAQGQKIADRLDQVTDLAAKADKKLAPEEASGLYGRLKSANPTIPETELRDQIAKHVDNYQPKVGSIIKRIDESVVPELEKASWLNPGAIGKVNEFKAAIKDAGSKASTEFGDDTISFKDAHALRVRIQNFIKENTNPLNPINATNDALKGIRTSLETEIEEAGDRAAKAAAKASPKGEGADWLKGYKEDKLAYGQLKVAARAASHATDLKSARRVVSPSDYGFGGVGSMVGALSGSAEHGLIGGGIGSVLGGAVLGAAHKVLRERGNSTAAVILNKAAVSREMVRAVTHVNKQIARGIDAIVLSHDRDELPKPKGQRAPDLHREFDEKSNAVMKAAAEENGHAVVEEHASLIGQHDQAMGSAFESTAIGTTAYLVNALPRAYVPAGSLQPQFDAHQPSDMAKAKWLAQVRGATDIPGTLADVKNGTITQPTIDAMKATAPGTYAQISQGLRDKAAGSKKQLSYSAQVSLKRFLGDPTIGSSLGPKLQANYSTAPAKHGHFPPHGGPAANVGLGMPSK